MLPSRCSRSAWLLLSTTVVAALGGGPATAAPTASEKTAQVLCDLSGRVLRPSSSGATVVELRRQIEWTTVDTKRTTVGPDGRYTFAPVAEGWYRISASADDRVPFTKAVFCSRDYDKGPLDLPLDDGGVVVSGRVTDTLGAPLAETEVSIVEVGRDRKEKRFKVATYVALDDEGHFELRVPPGRSYVLYANAPGHRFDNRELNLDPTRNLISHVDAAAEQIEVSFKLVPEPAIIGRVVTLDGKPAPGATVYLGPFGAGGPKRVSADDKGRFHLPALSPETRKNQPPLLSQRPRGRTPPPQPLMVAARHGAQVGYLNVGVLTPGEDREVTIDLEPGRRVTGQLRHQGKPIFGSVMWRVPAIGLFGSVNTDRQGAFAIEGLPTRQTVELFAAGGRHEVVEARPGVHQVEVAFVPRD